jgi:hypothetical protein
VSGHEHASRSKLEEQASRIVAEARAEATEVLRAAQVEADRILREAKTAARAIRADDFALDLRGAYPVLDVGGFDEVLPDLTDETLDELIAGAVSCAVRRSLQPAKVRAGRYLLV